MSQKDIYKRVYICAGQLLAENRYVSPLDLLIKMERVTLQQVGDWRFRRIPYLERVAIGNLAKMSTILSALGAFAKATELEASHTVYMSWGKGPKQQLRFSKSGALHMEQLYSTQYMRRKKKHLISKESGNHDRTVGETSS
jgi:hypothetical protein